ncbi:MAG: rRNA methyltransferase [Xanthomonadales bacterium]|nr:rRNA methyltransferase [Xanthomonadales bacterium]MBK7145090.1 rRNA methyltransferase [Xanthomonadales bacterium]MCC6560241.1 rRNA methyltransferase [Xanthomonadales bacterium]
MYTPIERIADARRGRRQSEMRVFGLHACMAVFHHRRAAIRKVYLDKELLGELREVISYCVANRLGYRLLPGEELEKLTKSQHHEGVCFEVLRAPLRSLEDALAAISPTQPAWFAWLDGVGNPHNLGAMLRSAAHFGCAGLILPRDAGLGLSGAACRVAEGGAEAVPLVGIDGADAAIGLLHRQDFQLLATVVRGGESLFTQPPPARAVFVMGAEEAGMSEALVARCDRRVGIPGSGAVESLNVSAAFAVFAAQWAAHCRP